MTDNLKKFLEEISNNDDLKEKVSNATKDTIISIAKEKGIELTEEDFAIPANQELSDDELDAVAGGESCICAFAGASDGDGLSSFCFILGGGGCQSDSHCTGHGNGACACVLGGYGVSDGRECNAGTNSRYDS